MPEFEQNICRNKTNINLKLTKIYLKKENVIYKKLSNKNNCKWNMLCIIERGSKLRKLKLGKCHLN
jgi:hypothetical protein